MNAKPSTIIIVGVFAFILQIILAPNIAIFGIAPQFLLIYVILMALRVDFAGAAALGFVVGLASGFITTAPLGLASFAFTLIALLACLLKSSAFSINFGMDSLALAVTLMLGELLVSFLYAAFGINNNFIYALLSYTLPSTLYDICAGIIIMAILNALFKKMSHSSYQTINRKFR